MMDCQIQGQIQILVTAIRNFAAINLAPILSRPETASELRLHASTCLLKMCQTSQLEKMMTTSAFHSLAFQMLVTFDSIFSTID